MIDALHMADIIFPTSEPFARLRTLGLYSSQLCALGLSCQAHSKSAETRALDVLPELKMALNSDAIPSRIAGPIVHRFRFQQLARGARMGHTVPKSRGWRPSSLPYQAFP